MQLNQAEHKVNISSLPGSECQTRPTARGTTGFSAAAAAGQSAEVLQLEVQRLAADRTMLVQKMQVCICTMPHVDLILSSTLLAAITEER